MLRVRGLKTYLATPEGMVRAVDGADFDIYPGEVVGLVGESGSGKTMTASSLLGLEPPSPGVIGGSAHFAGRDLLAGIDDVCAVEEGSSGQVVIRKDLAAWRRRRARNLEGIRGKQIAMIFQEPSSSLDPLYTVGAQIMEPLRRHRGIRSRQEARRQALEWLAAVRIHDPERIVDAYPQELSGGMCQRVMLAIALASQPRLLIADEPTTALDATIQVQILHLLREFNQREGISILLITHDMQIVFRYTDRVVVAYGGHIMEVAATSRLHGEAHESLHPYTAALLDAIPALQRARRTDRLRPIEGESPDPARMPPGCPFHPRCPRYLDDRCATSLPPLREVESDHHVRCWRWES